MDVTGFHGGPDVRRYPTLNWCRPTPGFASRYAKPKTTFLRGARSRITAVPGTNRFPFHKAEFISLSTSLAFDHISVGGLIWTNIEV